MIEQDVLKILFAGEKNKRAVNKKFWYNCIYLIDIRNIIFCTATPYFNSNAFATMGTRSNNLIGINHNISLQILYCTENLHPTPYYSAIFRINILEFMLRFFYRRRHINTITIHTVDILFDSLSRQLRFFYRRHQNADTRLQSTTEHHRSPNVKSDFYQITKFQIRLLQKPGGSYSPLL